MGRHSQPGQGAVRGRTELAPGKPRLHVSGPRGSARERAVRLRPEHLDPEMCSSAPSAAPRRLALGNTAGLARGDHVRSTARAWPHAGDGLARRCQASCPSHRRHGHAGARRLGKASFFGARRHQISQNQRG
jgi:hypothetical protein